MIQEIQVKKASGEQQTFSEDKLRNSLRRAGASDELIQSVIQQMQSQLYDGISTHEIYKKAFRLLHKSVRSLAARYSLKKAIMELGPTGFPFEKLVGEILKRQGYEVQTGVTMQGKCIHHEVDVLAEKPHEVIMVECKYHNTAGHVSGVQIPLYVNSRFQDIESVWKLHPGNENKIFHSWIVTNTRFSYDAETFGKCAGLQLLGWDYPKKGNLKYLIERAGLFPITALTGLSRKQKEILIDQDIILCSQLLKKPGVISGFEFNHRKYEEVMAELNDLCLSSELS